MAIYDMFDVKDSKETSSAPPLEAPPSAAAPTAAKDRFFSGLASRLFFLVLLIADAFWAAYAISLFILASLINLFTHSRTDKFQHMSAGAWLSIKRSLVCGLSLFVALFSPAFGIMVACTYFLMYDKAGIEEVVPSSLQDQFKEFFKS